VISLITTVTLKFPVASITGFTLFWSILGLFHQRERVRKGWFSGKAAAQQYAMILAGHHDKAPLS
jgi:hypothetical protein